MPTYTLFHQSGSGTLSVDATAYTLGMQFTVSQPVQLTGIWFYSPALATGLPVGTAIFRMTGAGTGTVVPGSQDNSPSWSGAAASGWVKNPYAHGPVLYPGNTYKACVLKDTTSKVYSFTSHYWDTGAGGSGLTSGALTAPNNAGGDGGQDTFITSGVFAYPSSSNLASNYWIDPEVATLPPVIVPPAYGQHPRRTLARAYIQSSPVTTGNAVPVPPAAHQPPYLPPRRVLSRALVQFKPVVTTDFIPPPPPAAHQPPYLPPRRVPSRAEVRFRPVVTVNPPPPQPVPTVQSRATLQVPRRTLARAHVRFVPVVTVNAPPSAGTGILWLPRRRTRRPYRSRYYEWTLMP